MTARQTQHRKAGHTSPHRRRPASDASTRWLGALLALAVAAAVIYFVASAKMPPQKIYVTDSLETVVTNPELQETIVPYKGMTVSFNPMTHQPNWVAWELLASETDGETPRGNNFQPDENVGGSATPADYRNSGYDRGHMAPAGDMKWSPESMRESFLMTNICPQAHDLNRGAWSKLEEKCRQRAVADSAVVIVCGPVFIPGEGTERIGDTGVAVPRRFFKVVLSPYADPPMAIGFIMPNGYVKGGMQACAVTVDSVEALTGHDFFSALPDDIEASIEARCDFNRWSRVRPKKNGQ